MDLGSAVLSAELAIELAGDDAPPIVLSEAPIVEGLVAAVVAAAGDATLAEVATEAANTAEIKAKLLGVGVAASADGELARSSPPPAASVEVALHNAHGLHARPAARLVETVRRFDAEVAVRNVTVAGPLVNARSISAVSTIGAVAGHHIEIQASGRQAREALAAVVALVRRNFDDNVSPQPASGQPANQSATSGPMAAAPGIGVGPKFSLASTRPAVTTDRVVGRPEDERARLIAAVRRASDDLQTTRQRVALATTEHEAAIFDAHLLLLDDADELVEHRDPVRRRACRDRRGRVAAGGQGARRPVRLAHRPVSTRPRRGCRRRGTPGGSAVERNGGGIIRQCRGCTRGTRPQPDGGSRARPFAGGRGRHRRRQPSLPWGDPRPLARDPDGGRRWRRRARRSPTGRRWWSTARPVSCCSIRHRTRWREYLERAATARRRDESLQQAATLAAVTSDGCHVEVAANIASVDDAASAIRYGADSVGLLRTEFLFLDRHEPPGEAEQFANYRAIADALGGRQAHDPDVGHRRRQARPVPSQRRRGQPVPRPARHPAQPRTARAVQAATPRHRPRRSRASRERDLPDGQHHRGATNGQTAARGGRNRGGLPAQRTSLGLRSRRHGRGARARPPRPRRGGAGRPVQHWHQRPHPIHAGGRARQRRYCQARRPARPGSAPADRDDHRGRSADRRGSRSAARSPPTRMQPRS